MRRGQPAVGESGGGPGCGDHERRIIRSPMDACSPAVGGLEEAEMNNPSQVRLVGPLAPYMAGYKAELEAKGYKPSSIANHLQLVAKVSRWLEADGLGVTGLTPDRIEIFWLF
jgi:hypothetical protein